MYTETQYIYFEQCFHFSKLGVPIKTSISPYVLEEAINGTITVRPLPLGRPVSDRASFYRTLILWSVNLIFFFDLRVLLIVLQVDKQLAHFYEITISEEEANAGIVVRVTSQTQSKFKVNLAFSTSRIEMFILWLCSNWMFLLQLLYFEREDNGFGLVSQVRYLPAGRNSKGVREWILAFDK